MKRLPPVALSCLASVLGSCSSIWVTDDYDREVDFAKLKTWSWRAAKADSAEAQDPTSLLTARIRSALEHELTRKGCTRVDSAGDFEVSFHTVVDKRIESTQTSTYYGYGWRHGGAAYAGPEVYTYDEGTLIVDFIDPKANHMIWRGTAGAVIDRQASSETREQRIKDAVEKLIALYPPRPRS